MRTVSILATRAPGELLGGGLEVMISLEDDAMEISKFDAL